MIACFPFVFTKLLDFVGIYGLLLSPIGAIVLTEHWIFPRLGWQRYWATRDGRTTNVPALAAWISAIAVGALLNRGLGVHLFFLFLPVYVSAAVVYLAAAAGSGARASIAQTSIPPSEQPLAAPARSPRLRSSSAPLAGIAILGLVACVGLSVWVFSAAPGEYLERLATMKTWLALPTLAYFAASTWLALSERT